jgi:hypothetical protein
METSPGADEMGRAVPAIVKSVVPITDAPAAAYPVRIRGSVRVAIRGRFIPIRIAIRRVSPTPTPIGYVVRLMIVIPPAAVVV